jgi:hypothetical protein
VADKEAFCEARIAEIAAATGLDPSLIEVQDVKVAAENTLKAVGAVDFSFIIRVADPAAAIVQLKAKAESGYAGSVERAPPSLPPSLTHSLPPSLTSVRNKTHDENACSFWVLDQRSGIGGSVPVELPVKELSRPLDVSGIQEVALVAVRACVMLQLLKELLNSLSASEGLSLLVVDLQYCMYNACGHAGFAGGCAPGRGPLAACAHAHRVCQNAPRSQASGAYITVAVWLGHPLMNNSAVLAAFSSLSWGYLLLREKSTS